MEATEIRSWPARAASSWRAIERMQAYQVPIVLGGALASFAGAVAFGPALVDEQVLGISWIRAAFVVVFGAAGLISYKVREVPLRDFALSELVFERGDQMFLEVVPIAENGHSKILPRRHRALRVFLILLDRPGPEAAVSGGYAG